jgi:hypothetical protein
MFVWSSYPTYVPRCQVHATFRPQGLHSFKHGPRTLIRPASTKFTLYIRLERVWIQRAVTVTARVNSLEAYLIPVAKQGGREATGANDITLHQSIRPRNRMTR